MTVDELIAEYEMLDSELLEDNFCEHGINLDKERCRDCDWLEWGDYQHDEDMLRGWQ